MDIRRIQDNKTSFLPLLLLADEQEDLIYPYLNRGELYALYDPDLRAVCVVTDEGGGRFELQNIAVAKEHQRKGYGSRLVQYVIDAYKHRGRRLIVGTGDSPITVPFYEGCGFHISHRLKNYILNTYDHPIYENGVQLFDKVVLTMDLPGPEQASEEST